MRHLLFILLLLISACGRDVRHAPLPTQVYVWQRVWRPEVSEAVRSAKFAALHVLAAEMRVKDGRPEIIKIEPDWRALEASGAQIGAVLRVHASVGKSGWSEALVGELRVLCTGTITRFRSSGARLAELQLDYDCAESRLADYARLLGKLQTDVPIRITALPAWLRHDAVRPLLACSPGYVLQVHSLHLPKDGGLTGLMDMDETQQAVGRAVEIGVPFRVALPTYSCVVEFADDGRVRDLHAEDMPAGLAISGRKYAVLDSDAYALSSLAADWQVNAPELMQALIWYRLPVSTDRLNWPTGLLSKVARGETLKRGWTASARLAAEGHHEIVIRQDGEAPDDLPLELLVSWKGADVEGCDGLRGYKIQGHMPGRMGLWLEKPERFGRVRPGEEIVVSWLRLPAGSGDDLAVKFSR